MQDRGRSRLREIGDGASTFPGLASPLSFLNQHFLTCAMADAEIQQLRQPWRRLRNVGSGMKAEMQDRGRSRLREIGGNVVSKADIPLKERFFRYFQHEITGMFSLIRTQTPLCWITARCRQDSGLLHRHVHHPQEMCLRDDPSPVGNASSATSSMRSPVCSR
jgi:hypothetical protein